MSKEVKLHSKPESNGRVYTTIWRNGEIETLDKELNKFDINLANNENRTLIDYDEGFCGLRLTWEYNCEPYGLRPSADKWQVSWTLVEEEWEDIPNWVYDYMDDICKKSEDED